MRLNDFEALVQVFLHGLVIDQVLLELLGQLGAKNLQILLLFPRALSELNDLLVNVAR